MQYFKGYIFLLVLLDFLMVKTAISQEKAEELYNIDLTDINGNSYTLFDELNQGRIVVFDFFAYYCTTCQANTPAVNDIWLNNSPGDSLWVWGIETSGYSPEYVQNFSDTYGSDFPSFATDSINRLTYDPHVTLFDQFGIYGTPTYIVVCPDHSFAKYPIESLQDGINECKTVTSIARNNIHNNALIDRITKNGFDVVYSGDYSGNYTLLRTNGALVDGGFFSGSGRISLKLNTYLNKGVPYILEVNFKEQRIVKKVLLF